VDTLGRWHVAWHVLEHPPMASVTARAVYAEWEGRKNDTVDDPAGRALEQVKMDAGAVRGYSTAATAMGFQARDASRLQRARPQQTRTTTPT
jgi:hypothetical protein